MQLIVDTKLLDAVLNKLYYLFRCGSKEDDEDLNDPELKDADNLEQRDDENDE